MKKTSFFQVLIEYIKRHCMGVVIFAILIITPLIVLPLYGIAKEAVLYNALLCVVVSAVVVAVDFSKYYKKHCTLERLQEEICLSINNLPVATDLLEKDYQNLIDILFTKKGELISQRDSSESDMMCYYTTWVHQIKTPIAAMDLLLQGEKGEIAKEISGELFKIRQYVEMVLSYARLESDSNDFVIQKYDLDGIVRQGVHKFAGSFVKKKISLKYEPLNCTVLTDEKWLLFVIEQILSNALKYTNKGSISIYMENEKNLVIEDTGIGIAAEDLARIFENGFTGYNGRNDKKSTGIGLYISKRILNKLSHSISITSCVGKGTKAVISLQEITLEVE